MEAFLAAESHGLTPDDFFSRYGTPLWSQKDPNPQLSQAELLAAYRLKQRIKAVAQDYTPPKPKGKK